jgi:hypothetical protein
MLALNSNETNHKRTLSIHPVCDPNDANNMSMLREQLNNEKRIILFQYSLCGINGTRMRVSNLDNTENAMSRLLQTIDSLSDRYTAPRSPAIMMPSI